MTDTAPATTEKDPKAELLKRNLETSAKHFNHNRAVALYSDLGALEDRLANLGEVTEDTAPVLRDIKDDAHKRATELEDERKEDQKPAMDTLELIRSAYRPLVDGALAVKESAQLLLNGYLEKERLRLLQEERDALELARQERLAAELAAEELANESGFTANPAVADALAQSAAQAEINAQYASRVAASGPKVASATGSARAAGYTTTYSANVTDYVKAAKFFKNDPGVREAIQKAANAAMRSSKGTLVIPGVDPVEKRSAR